MRGFLNMLPSPMRSLWTFFGYVMAIGTPLWKIVTWLGNVDFVIGYANPLLNALNTAVGTLILMVVGFGLLFWGNYKERSELRISPQAPRGRKTEDVISKQQERLNNSAPRLVTRVLEEGPKILYAGELAYEECRVPYKDESNPTIIGVEGPDDAYLITLSYLARKGSYREDEKEPEDTKIVGTTYLKILDEDGNVVRSKVVNMAWENMPVDSRQWYYSVSCDTVVSGLPKGRYGLEVYDSSSGIGGREYRNMLMNVIHLGDAGMLPAPEEWHGWKGKSPDSTLED